MSETIIDKLNSSPGEITEKDIDTWVISEVVDFFDPKFPSLARFAYGELETGSNIALRAFREDASKVLKKGLVTFLLTSQHWRSGRDIQPYLITCIKRLAGSLKQNAAIHKKKAVPACPGCKASNQKSFLRYEDGMLRCHSCTNEQLNLEEQIKSELKKSKQDKSLVVRLRSEIRLKEIFSLHSRKGYKCPECAMFIPDSIISGQRASCPYDLTCMWFGHIDELELMNHPTALATDKPISLNSTITSAFSDGKDVERQDLLDSGDISADTKIEVRQKCEEEIFAIYSVIEDQLAAVKRSSSHKSIKKVLMYEAFKKTLDQHPAEMVSYLAHRSHGSGGLPIQARIFQNFIEIVENSLPIEITHDGEVVEIYSIQDPRLDLFAGFSEFEGIVRPDGIIPNGTKEVYIGSRKGNNHGPCFIGQLVDIQALDADNQSIMEFLDFYTFSQIKMKNDIPPGLRVKVSHFRILSHYEMQGLVYLQRIRRRIVDSVHFRLNGEKRVVGKC